MFDFPVAYFNSNNDRAILGFGKGPQLVLSKEQTLDDLQQFIDQHQGNYIFSCLSYDLKNKIEHLNSNNTDQMGFPDAILWVPETVVEIEDNQISFLKGELSEENASFLHQFLEYERKETFEQFDFNFKARTTKQDYLNHVNRLKEEIQQGNIYEVNYCQEYFAENTVIENPLEVYFKLNSITEAPYSVMFSLDDHTVFCGSPELYISKEDDLISSSPIKGTSKRGKSEIEDTKLKEQLFNDTKERAENVMIVDLVRNDLSKIAQKGSVQVDELFGVYSFKTVHQLISTISCKLQDEVHFDDILQASFPMGSMTGAPKISAMQLIEEHEDFKRGIYSGAIGFIDPDNNFIFNVVIRSLVYNQQKQYLSCAVGGAITINSDPEKEYQECEVKVKGIMDQMNE